MGFLPEVGTQLHRFPQGVYGRVGNLGCVEEEMIPVDRVFGRIAHGGKEDSPCVSLGVKVTDMGGRPGLVLFESLLVPLDCNRAGRAESRTSSAADALGAVLGKIAVGFDKGMNAVTTLPYTDLAADALAFASVYVELIERFINCFVKQCTTSRGEG